MGGNSVNNLRQVLEDKMKKCGLRCRCIRCREVKNKDNDINSAKLKVRSYIASGGTEYHITIESKSIESQSTENDDDILYGFLRLRLSKESGYINTTNLFPYLNECALIRELHVYGNMTSVLDMSSKSSQHRGFGKMMMKEAENIAIINGYNKIAVISGVGVRAYYMKLGYSLVDTYMIKTFQLPKLENDTINYNLFYIILFILFYIIVILFIYNYMFL